ncbi:MAG: hypothetical protein V3W20_03185, partial [Candidatus Neomarinimicrobiota bacterium]
HTLKLIKNIMIVTFLQTKIENQKQFRNNMKTMSVSVEEFMRRFLHIDTGGQEVVVKELIFQIAWDQLLQLLASV